MVAAALAMQAVAGAALDIDRVSHAFDIDGNLYVAASLRGHRGIVRRRLVP